MHKRSALRFTFIAILLGGAAPAHAAWIRNGDSLCTAAGVQQNAAAVSDGSGGTIVVWRDQRNGSGNGDLYARSISSTGVLRWAATGIPVCTAINTQTNQQVTTDDKGGAIAVWEDSRKTVAGSAIYAQRIRANGNIAWTLNGVAVDTTTGYQTQPSIVPDGASGAIVAWTASRGGRSQVYAQRLDSTGVAKWTASGIPVAPTLTEETYVVMAADGSNGALLAWSDARSTAGGYNSIYAQRITLAGGTAAGWSATGVSVCDATHSPSVPQIAQSDSGGAVICWEDYRDYLNTGANIYAQRIQADGTPRWAVDGVPVCAYGSDQLYPEVVTDGVGGAIFSWQDQRAGMANANFFSQRLAANGTPQWTLDGISLCTALSHRSDMTMIPDGAGGAIGAWVDYRSGVATDIYAQRVSGAGALPWGANAVAICDTTNDQQLPVLVSDGANGAVIAWHDNRASNYDIYAQHITSAGAVGGGGSTAVDLALPLRFALEPPRPNPATGPVGLGFRLPTATALEVTVFDLAGRSVRHLARGERFEAGAHQLSWDGRDDAGALTSPGLYFVAVRAGAERAEARVVRVQ